MGNFGIIKDAIDVKKLFSWRDIYKKGQQVTMQNGDPCWGIDRKSLMYAWCMKTVMPVIWANFDSDQKMIYSAYKDICSPFGIHKDLKPLPEGAVGSHSMSILFPVSTEGGTIENLHKVSTCFFDDEKRALGCIPWEANSIVWWNSDVFHSASDFIKQGIKTKQFFITHTYV